MRDKNRIEPFLIEFCKVWKEKFPDWRFGQLVENLRNFNQWYNHTDLFYLEEKDFLELLKIFIETSKRKENNWKHYVSNNIKGEKKL